MLEGPFAKILPLLIFGVTSVVAGLSALILPETGNIKLPDTLQDIGGYSRLVTINFLGTCSLDKNAEKCGVEPVQIISLFIKLLIMT